MAASIPAILLKTIFLSFLLHGVKGQGSIITEVVAEPGQIRIPFVGFRRTVDGVRFLITVQNVMRDLKFDLKDYLLTDRRLEFGGAMGGEGYIVQHSGGHRCKFVLKPLSGIPVDLKRAVESKNVPDYAAVFFEKMKDSGCGFSENEIIVSKFAGQGGSVYLYSPPYGPNEAQDRTLIAQYTWDQLQMPQRIGETTFSTPS